MSPEESRAAWDVVLTALERDAVTAADAATVSGTGGEPSRSSDATWVEPTGLGPVPRELVGRASRLLAAQRDRTAALEEERRVTLEHLGALRAVDATREPRGSVYLDASA